MALLAAACADDGSGSDGGAGPGVEPFLLEVEVGECFDRPASPDVTEVPVVACDRPHELELYAVLDLADGEFPGAAGVAERAGARCEERFAEYVGRPAERSGLIVVPFAPTRQTWEAGDRTVRCALGLTEGELRESKRGAELDE